MVQQKQNLQHPPPLPPIVGHCVVYIGVCYGHNDNDNDSELFVQTKSNEKHHKGTINNTNENTTLQCSCQGDCTEDIMAASIQPPVTFLKFNPKNYRLNN